jgi:hypothetical protein
MQYKKIMHLLLSRAILFSMLSSSGEIESFEEANHGLKKLTMVNILCITLS